MSLRQKLDFAFNRAFNKEAAKASPSQVILDEILNYINNIVSGGYNGLTYNNYSAVCTFDDPQTTPKVKDGYTHYGLIPNNVDKNTYISTFSIDYEQPSGIAKLKMHMDSLTNQQAAFTGFGTNLRLYDNTGNYSSISLNTLLEDYGDWLVFDFNLFNETMYNQSTHAFLAAYDSNDTIIENTKPIALSIGNITLPFIYSYPSSVTSPYGGSSPYVVCLSNCVFNPWINDYGSIYLTPFSLDWLIYMYSGFNSGLSPTDASVTNNQLMGDYIRRVSNYQGNRQFYIFHKDIVDELLVDLMELTGLNVEYSGDIITPTPPVTGISAITFDKGVMTPSFDTQVSNYEFTTIDPNFTIDITSGEGSTLKLFKGSDLLKQDVETLSYNYRMANNEEIIYIKCYDDENVILNNITIKLTLLNDTTKLTSLTLKDLSQNPAAPISLTPYFDSTVLSYNAKIDANCEEIMVSLTYTNADTVTVNGEPYSIAKPFSISVPDNRVINIELTKDETTLTYLVYLTNEISETIPYGEIYGGDIGQMTGSGAISGASQAAGFVSNYPPGFYGGSYIPNYRYVQPVDTTANGSADYENDFINRKAKNENAVVLLNQIIAGYTVVGALDAICEAFIHYSNFINDDSGNINWRYVLPAINVNISRPLTLTTEHFTPKNKKCFTYPFSSLELNGYGTSSDLAYEDFTHTFSSGQHVLGFDIFAKWFAGVSIQLVPVNYKNIEDNFDYAVAGPEMPVFPFTKNEYLNEYYASRETRSQALEAARENADLAKKENFWNSVVNVGQGVASAGFAAKMGSAAGAVGGGISAVGAGISGVYSRKKIDLQLNQLKKSLASELADIGNRPATVTNQNASPSITMVSKDAACPFVIHKSLRAEILKKVDRFFTRFGYKTNRTGIPNIYQRPNFDYLECKNAVVGGNIPAEDKQALKEIFEHGITFWHYGSSGFKGVGDYGDADYTYNLAPTR